jgi:hypothetical protein
MEVAQQGRRWNVETKMALIGAAIGSGFTLAFLLWVMITDDNFNLESSGAVVVLSIFVGLIGFMVLKGCS